jgi:hypothetical protein
VYVCAGYGPWRIRVILDHFEVDEGQFFKNGGIVHAACTQPVVFNKNLLAIVDLKFP